MKRVVIVGGGFAGLNAAKGLGNHRDVHVTLVDRRNYHLFQPLLYQVAMAGLSPAEIAVPIRRLLAKYRNVDVLQENVHRVDLAQRQIHTEVETIGYDYLVLACGAQHAYFGNEAWEPFAPGLKTIEQATEIRRRVLSAYEQAERTSDAAERKKCLTFVVVGGGPTGVELAGALGEMSRFTLAKDFRHIDPKLARVVLIEAGPRILPMFSAQQASRATRDLEKLGVHVWTNSFVTNVSTDGVAIGEEHLQAGTVLWAAGVKASEIGATLGTEQDRQDRVLVGEDLTLPDHPNVFVVGDQAHVVSEAGPLPGVAPVAVQQGRFVAKTIRRDLQEKPRKPFAYLDKGQMATIGRSRAIVETGKLKIGGFFAWVMWLFVHIYYLTGFKNRLFVIIQWAWSYVTFGRGARLIVGKEWRSYPDATEKTLQGSSVHS